MNTAAPLLVVCAWLMQDEKVLVARKAKGKRFEGLWEFPGGKVEIGESEPTALMRELQEELAISVLVQSFAFANIHHYDFGPISLRAWWCKLAPSSKEPQTREHSLLHWCPLLELLRLDWCPADFPLAQKLYSLA